MTRESLHETMPPLCGLVMAGGRSRRMGTDKGSLVFHDRSQRARGVELLRPHCRDVFVSCRPDQASSIEPDLVPLFDRIADAGPLAGLHAAFRHDPEAAWLVVACDLPLLGPETIAHLVASRSAESGVTAYRSPEDGQIEPLVAIWEPVMAARIETAVAAAQFSLRGILQATDCRLVEPRNRNELRNVNLPPELEAIRHSLDDGPPG